MTPAEVIVEVRKLIQDTLTPYRYSDDSLLGYVNQTVKRMALLRPDLFSYIGDINTTAGSVVQTCPADSIRLMEIFHVTGGNAVTEVSRQTLERSTPGWAAVASGTPVNYMRHPRNPNRYFLYPRPTTGVQLLVEYTQVPQDYASGDTISLLPDAYLPVVVDGVVFLSEAEDNEHVSTGRSKLFQEMFISELAVGLKGRAVTDTEDSALEERKYVSDPRDIIQ